MILYVHFKSNNKGFLEINLEIYILHNTKFIHFLVYYFKVLLTLQIFDFLFSLHYDFKLSALSRNFT